MPDSTPGKVLTGMRLAIGTGAWVAPSLSGRAFGLDPDANPQASFVGRLFAVRDAVLGAGVLSSDGEARRLWWRLGVVCDVADAAAAVIAGRNGDLPTFAAAMSTATALTAAGLGVAALAADDV